MSLQLVSLSERRPYLRATATMNAFADQHGPRRPKTKSPITLSCAVRPFRYCRCWGSRLAQ
jgi:hypothetical protein